MLNRAGCGEGYERGGYSMAADLKVIGKSVPGSMR